MDRPATARSLALDLALATGLALVLTFAWTLRDWPNLSALRLPDTDDVMRLQQIRDWLAGQRFADLAQHRLSAAPGLEMHWSRLPDLVPAAVILMLRPLVGTQGAELAAVIAWPALLFAAALALAGSVARALGTSGPTAIVIAALAYPATAEFMPGRIDHHGLQLVLVLVLARALVGPGSLGWGAAAGIATAASLAIGLETAPLLAVAGTAAALLWATRQAGADARLAGYAVALAGSLGAAGLLLRTSGWSYPACDGFDTQAWRAAQIAALGPLALAAFGGALRTILARLVAAVAAGAAAIGAAVLISPGCLHPYGAVDPLLARVWLANVAEAQPLLAAPVGTAIGYAGLAIAGVLAALWTAWRARAPGWMTLAALQLAAVAVTFAQLRGAYAGALLAAPALAGLIAAARSRGALALVAGWLASAGLIYPLLADALPSPGGSPTEAAAADCTAPAALARIARLPRGNLLAPMDLGAFALASSPHRIVAAPYHRNGTANRAMYRIFLGPEREAEALARRWQVDDVAICPNSFAEAGPARGLAAALSAGRVPAWLRPVSRPGEMPMLYVVTKPAGEQVTRTRWWEGRGFVLLALLLAAAPLLWPSTPPLIDVPGHMGRYRVMLGTDADVLGQRYRFAWHPIGYLGVDLLVAALGPVLGLEPAVKLVVLAIPVLTAAGVLWISREVHGRVEPLALFALPLGYHLALQYGFVNYCLAMALTLNAFAWWLRLARLGRLRLRAVIFVPLSCAIWTAHLFGWLVLGLLAFCAELARAREAGRSWPASVGAAALGCLPLTLPFVMFLAWRPGGGDPAGDYWASLKFKPGWLVTVLRDRWQAFDIASMMLVLLVLYRCARSPRFERAPALVLAAAGLLVVFLLMPFGSAYADMRLAPYVVILALLAIRAGERVGNRERAILALVGLAFLGVRTVATTASFAIESRAWTRHLATLDHVPRGTRMVTFAVAECDAPWRMYRLGHLAGMAIVRRAAFSNDQFDLGTTALLTVTAPGLKGFATDPSQIVTRTRCDHPSEFRTLAQALSGFPRDRFDLVWLIGAPFLDPRLTAGLTPVWRSGSDLLLRVDHLPPALSPKHRLF